MFSGGRWRSGLVIDRGSNADAVGFFSFHPQIRVVSFVHRPPSNPESLAEHRFETKRSTRGSRVGAREASERRLGIHLYLAG
jgi:hypothetical protein